MIGDKYNIGDLVLHRDDPAIIGDIRDIITDSLDDTMYHVYWLDGYDFIYYKNELTFCDYTDFLDRIKERL